MKVVNISPLFSLHDQKGFTAATIRGVTAATRRGVTAATRRGVTAATRRGLFTAATRRGLQMPLEGVISATRRGRSRHQKVVRSATRRGSQPPPEGGHSRDRFATGSLYHHGPISLFLSSLFSPS